MIEWITTLIGIGGSFAANIASAAVTKEKKDTKGLYNVKDVKPRQIMGDRGDEDNGFYPNLFYQPLVGNAVPDAVSNSNINLVVITGRFASGKSRAVYEFLKSDECKYSNVFIVPTTGERRSCIEYVSSQIETLNPDDTIVVIDDINNIFDVDASDLGLGSILSTLTNRSFKVLITLSKGERFYKKFMDNCRVGCDLYRGKRSGSVIKTIEIPKIEKGDNCFIWCRTNFFSGLYSTVIGGYIPNLKRSIERNLYIINNYETARNLLISYYVGVKFRHNEGVKAYHIRKMYTLKFGDISDADFDDAIETLKALGFIAEDYDYEGEGTAYKVNDMMIYDAFVSQCGCGLMGKQAYSLMANTIDAEKEQSKWLLSTDPDSPTLYSRILFHSRLKETKDYAKECLNGILNDEEHFSQEHLQPYLEDPIPALIEIYGEGEYYEVRKLIEQKGIVPTIEIVCALLRISPRTLIQDEIVDYAQHLVNKFELQRTIYYYRCVEQLDPEYDMQRVEAVQAIYDDDPDGEFMLLNYQRYCTELLSKAMNKSMSDFFWDNIAPTGLTLNKKSVYSYCDNVSKKTRNLQSETLLVDFFVRSAKYDWDINRCTMASILLEACPTFGVCYNLYNVVIDSLGEEDIENHALSLDEVRCMLIFPLLNKLSYKREDDVDKARELVLQCLSSGDERDDVWFSSRRKILNKYLSRMGSYDSMLEELKFITDSNLKDFVNDDTIATAVSVVNKTMDDNFNYRGVLEDVKKISELKAEYGKVTHPSYNTSLYKLARRMLDRKADVAEVSELLGYVDESVGTDNEIIVAARLGCILNEEEAIREIEEQKDKIKDDHYINPDMISNLMMSVNGRFRKSRLIREKMEELIKCYVKHVNIPNHSLYRQLLRYDLATGKLKPENLIEKVDSLNDRFLAAQMPLVDNGYDLFRVCIKSPFVDVWTALDLLYEVDRQSLADSRKSDLWRVKLLKNFVEKMTRDNTLTSEDVRTIVTGDLQDMIDRHIDVDYSTDINNIVKSLGVLKRRYNIKGFFALNFPLTSIYPNMRHGAWKYYVTTQSLDSLHESSLIWFIKREEEWLVRNPHGDRSYLQMAIKELRRRDPNAEIPAI